MYHPKSFLEHHKYRRQSHFKSHRYTAYNSKNMARMHLGLNPSDFIKCQFSQSVHIHNSSMASILSNIQYM